MFIQTYIITDIYSYGIHSFSHILEGTCTHKHIQLHVYIHSIKHIRTFMFLMSVLSWTTALLTLCKEAMALSSASTVSSGLPTALRSRSATGLAFVAPQTLAFSACLNRSSASRPTGSNGSRSRRPKEGMAGLFAANSLIP